MSNIDHLDKRKTIMSKDRATNWELHDGADDGYLDEEKDSTSDPEENMPLSRTFNLHTTPDVTIRSSEPLAKRKAVMGGNLYNKVSNRKNRDPYFNLVKNDIIDSSEHTVTLDNGHVLRKSDLAIKGKILPGPKKIIVNQTPIGHNLHTDSSLAGKRKLSPPKKAVSTPAGHSGQGTSRTANTRVGTSAPTVSTATQHSRTENCTTICQPVDNSKFNFKSITFTDKVLLHFLLLNRHFIPFSKKQSDLPMDKVNEPLLIIPEEHNIALKFRDDRLHPTTQTS